LINIVPILIVSIISGCASLNDYEVINKDEEAIVNQLNIFRKAFNKEDVSTFLDLFSEDAKIMTGKERRVISKQRYAGYISNKMTELYINHMGMPKIKIDGNTANVKVTIVISGTSVYHNLTFVQDENSDKWLIGDSKHHF